MCLWLPMRLKHELPPRLVGIDFRCRLPMRVKPFEYYRLLGEGFVGYLRLKHEHLPDPTPPKLLFVGYP